MDDNELVKRIQEGDHHAFEQLVTRHLDRFLALAFRSLGCENQAQDVMQECWLKFWKKPTMFNSNRAKFSTWFYRVVINACHDARQKTLSYHHFIVNHPKQETTFIENPATDIEQLEIVALREKKLEQAISDLPVSQQDALNLAVYDDLPIKEVAIILGLSDKAVESLLYRARRTLKSKMISNQANLMQPAWIS